MEAPLHPSTLRPLYTSWQYTQDQMGRKRRRDRVDLLLGKLIMHILLARGPTSPSFQKWVCVL